MTRVVDNAFHKAPLALAVTIACAVWTGHAVAQQTTAVQELAVAKAKTTTEDDVKVEQSANIKFTQPLLDTAKTITVIPQAVMKDRAVDSLRDALRNVSGISLAAGEGGAPSGDSMSIRGFKAATDIFVDGIRDIAGYSRDTYNLESIEVAKGPGSAVSGRGATGGSINLQSKTAKLDQFTDVSLRIGSESDYRATLDSNISLGDSTALRLNLLTDDADVAGRDNVFNSKNAAAMSLATGIGSAQRFSLNAEYQKQDNMPDYGIPWVSDPAAVPELTDYLYQAPPVSFDNFYGNVFRDYEDISAQSLTGRFEQDISDTTTLRMQARLGSVAREGVVTAPRFYNQKTGTEVRQSDEKTRDSKNSLQAVQLDLIGEYQTGGVKHNVVSGIEWAAETFKRWNMVDLVDDNLDSTPSLVDLYHPDAHVPFTGQYGRDGNSIKAEGKNIAVYLFDTLTLTPQWELTLGGRWDKFETDYQYSYTDAALVADTRDSVFSWNAGLVFKPASNGSIYFALGNSFNPSAEGLTVSTNSNSNLVDLEPEETLSYEFGTKWDLFDSRLLASAAIFRTEKNHARTDDPDFSGDQSSFDTLNGEQRVQGLELSAVGYIKPNWTLIAAYTYQDSEITHAEGDDASQIGMPLSGTPEHSASVWTRYDFNDQLAFGAGAQYVGERFNSSSANRKTAAGYTTYDLMLAYQLTDKIGMQLNGINLSDKRYIEQLGGGHFIPGEGRHVSVTAHYNF
ncbi:TonB-dependent receptor [Rheinheimera baltica]|uniref:TonB-dependent receptor n=1 Tax=Rheinheimera baltica TaxID=67576 RepID=UPI000563B01C|nr:TonB-dependent siderophore receptor [Rheinheimera baltica]